MHGPASTSQLRWLVEGLRSKRVFPSVSNAAVEVSIQQFTRTTPEHLFSEERAEVFCDV
jgi:hypothetical protein